MLPYLVLLRVGFALPPPVTGSAVRSYRTFSPFPHTARRTEPCGVVCFLWHFPSARAAQALPGTLPFGARTFLATFTPNQRTFKAEATRLSGQLPAWSVKPIRAGSKENQCSIRSVPA